MFRNWNDFLLKLIACTYCSTTMPALEEPYFLSDDWWQRCSSLKTIGFHRTAISSINWAVDRPTRDISDVINCLLYHNAVWQLRPSPLFFWNNIRLVPIIQFTTDNVHFKIAFYTFWSSFFFLSILFQNFYQKSDLKPKYWHWKT